MGTSAARALDLNSKVRLRQLSFHAPEELHNTAELSDALDERLEMALDESERVRTRSEAVFAAMKEPPAITEEDLLALAIARGADLCGVAEYFDARYHRKMWAVVIALGMPKERTVGAAGPGFRDYSGLKDLHAVERANQLAYALLSKGIGAVPAVPWGLHTFEVDLVRLGEEAGLGRIGLNRCLLVPGYGPRVKLAAVCLRPGTKPLRRKKPAMPDVCKACGICVPACPAGALKAKDPDACRLHFRRYFGCGVCVQACPL
jgi:ferredoxin